MGHDKHERRNWYEEEARSDCARKSKNVVCKTHATDDSRRSSIRSSSLSGGKAKSDAAVVKWRKPFLVQESIDSRQGGAKAATALVTR
jgi:hypothetical protein